MSGLELLQLPDADTLFRKLRTNGVLGQPQHDPEHQEGEEHTLCRVENDSHPRAPVAIGRESEQKTGKDIVQYSPGLVNVIESEEYTICHPAPASEHTFHPGQEHAPTGS